MRYWIDKHVTDVPERLKEVDQALRVCFNTDSQTFEVWGLDKEGPYILGDFTELDYRVVGEVRYGYWCLRNQHKPWLSFLDGLRERRDQIIAEGDRKLDEMLEDDFQWFGQDLYPGWGRGGADGYAGGIANAS